MKLKNSTILITGGSAGIGLEFARQLLQQGATIIITGRDVDKLNAAKKQLPQVHTFQCNINNPKEIKAFYIQVTAQFPELNIVINNAGIMHSVQLLHKQIDVNNVADEIETNFSGTVRMIHQFLPHLMNQKSSAVINITSGLGFIPFTISPIYCGTKAGVHIYSLALRLQLKNTSIKVFEVAPPKTDKPLQTALPETSNKGMMKVDKLVSIAIQGILKDTFEIRPGLANVMKWMSRIAPDFFTKFINKNIEKAKSKTI